MRKKAKKINFSLITLNDDIEAGASADDDDDDDGNHQGRYRLSFVHTFNR